MSGPYWLVQAAGVEATARALLPGPCGQSLLSILTQIPQELTGDTTCSHADFQANFNTMPLLRTCTILGHLMRYCDYCDELLVAKKEVMDRSYSVC